MSNFNNASLIVTPNAKKAGKLYALKGADLDVVRATTATYVGSDGLIKTAGINEVRFDYTNGSCPSILVEPQRTNLVFPSATATTQTRTVTATAHTLSFYGTGSVVLSGVATGTLVGTGTNNRVTLTFTPTAGSLILTVVGSVTNWQLEAGANATSYIPTDASTVTRNADVISKSGISSLIGQTEGTIYFELDFKANNIANTIISIGDGGVANRMFLSCDSSNRISVVVRNSTGFQYSFTSLQQISGIKKISLSYKANDFDFFINGLLLNSSNSGVLPLNISVLNLEVGNTLTKENNINNILLFKEKLTNEQCIALTTL